MTKQFTASEVCAYLRHVGDGIPTLSDMLHAYADRLEADEKVAPVAYALFTEKGLIRMWSREWFADAHGAPVNPTPLYTHPAPSDAERLAEALRQAAQSLRTIERGAMREEGLEDAENVRAYARSRADVAGNALTAHSAQAQPPAASVTDAIARRMVAEYDAVLCGDPTATRTDGMRAALEAALAAQENPNG